MEGAQPKGPGIYTDAREAPVRDASNHVQAR